MQEVLTLASIYYYILILLTGPIKKFHPPPPIGVIDTVTKLLTRAFQRYMTHDNQTKFLSLKVDLRRKNSLVFSLFLKNGKSNGNDTYTIGKQFKRGIQTCIL